MIWSFVEEQSRAEQSRERAVNKVPRVKHQIIPIILTGFFSASKCSNKRFSFFLFFVAVPPRNALASHLPPYSWTSRHAHGILQYGAKIAALKP